MNNNNRQQNFPIPSKEKSLASPYLEFVRQAMATDFVLQLNMGQYANDKSAALDALDVVSRLERELSYFIPDSVVGELNRTSAEIPVFPDEPIYDLFRLCQTLFNQTQGAFDITAGRLWEIWGFSRRAGQVPAPEEIQTALETRGEGKLSFLDDVKGVARTDERTRVNLGAIGKGYALDRASRFLVDCGVTDFLFHGGASSVVAMGNRTDSDGWEVGLHNPLRQTSPENKESTRLETIRLHNQALATSGSQTQFFRAGGKRYGHIIDPRTGYPASTMPDSPVVYSSTVIVPIQPSNSQYDFFAAAKADALATAFYILGSDAAQEYCTNNQGIEFIFVLPDNKGKLPYKVTHIQ
ncbi:MAG: FAD:protein FMN transferase [Thermoguttaceae bacterium]|nr:FAD:protein FMN transferase [Thermoguttaceae bacterium]